MKKTAELLRLMRNEKFYRDGKEDESVKRIVKSYADMIEDAIKWDYTGNVAKLREVLGVARELILSQCHGGTPFSKVCAVALVKIDSALAEPLRNCEVGTAEEQAIRFEAYCDSHTNCAHCPLKGQQCVLAWSQMLYESEVK